MNVELWPIERVIPYPRNARVLSDAAIDTVAKSIQEYGWRQPIVVDTAGVVIAGHTRLLAAKKLGLKEVPVHVATELSPAQVKAYRLMDNRSHEESSWDDALLGEELFDLEGLGLDLSLTGFSEEELAGLMVEKTEGLTDPDEVPETPEQPVTQMGDLWVLGKHRLLCGDATEAEDVKRVMIGSKAGLMNTDPPYGVGYANDERPHPGVAKDELQNEALQTFLESAFGAAKSALLPKAAWYLWHAHLTQGFFAAAAAAAAHVILHRQIIWVKPVLLLGRGQYHWKHEPCFMGWVEGHQPPDLAERNQTTVWEIGSISTAERKEFNHSTPKPVELFRRPILKHLKAGAIAYEPFAGTGPQFIAAEETGRCCYGLEIEPAYCDVIVVRWQNFTGKKATLDGDGRTFEEMKEARLAVTA
ncbi:MAG TPA: DNA methyltransferase [Acidobacteriaceae bacterium]|jgi:DNA modification methylase